MDLERIDVLLSQLYNQAVALQQILRLLEAGKVHDVSLTPEQRTQLTQKGRSGLGSLRTIMNELETELGAA